jgi:hypothetical protein
MDQKIAIITGASSGIGREFTQRIHTYQKLQLDELWLIARNREKLESIKSPIPIKLIVLDLTENDSFSQLYALLRTEHPNVRLLFNGSGFGIFERFDRINEYDALGMIDLNCRALTRLTQLALPYMSAGSQIVNIASVAAFQPVPYGGIYAATKSYVLSFSRSLNRELKPLRIKVLAVCPYWTKTAFFDRANKQNVITHFECMYTPEFIVKKTLRAMKTKKDYTVPGGKAKWTQILTKILPHKLVMSVFLRRQKIKSKQQ